jgi:hypothetical protein
LEDDLKNQQNKFAEIEKNCNDRKAMLENLDKEYLLKSSEYMEMVNKTINFKKEKINQKVDSGKFENVLTSSNKSNNTNETISISPENNHNLFEMGYQTIGDMLSDANKSFFEKFKFNNNELIELILQNNLKISELIASIPDYNVIAEAHFGGTYSVIILMDLVKNLKTIIDFNCELHNTYLDLKTNFLLQFYYNTDVCFMYDKNKALVIDINNTLNSMGNSYSRLSRSIEIKHTKLSLLFPTEVKEEDYPEFIEGFKNILASDILDLKNLDNFNEHLHTTIDKLRGKNN